MKTWSMAINEQGGDIDTMPAALAKTLMPAKLGTKNPLRENPPKPPDTVPNHSTAANHPATLPPLPGPMNPYYHLPPLYYNAYNGPYHQPGYLQPPQQAAPSPKRPRHRSSSLPSEFDSSIDKLTDYIAWLIKRYPTKSEQLTACLETLKDKDIVFETVETIDRDRWEAWGVSDGISLMVKSHQHKWERRRHG